MSIAVKSGLPSLGSTEGAVITKDDISVTEETSPSASAGEDLPRGKSAYEVAVENGFSGTETEWLASLKGATGAPGADGKDGTDGKTPYVGDNGNWYIGTDDTGKPSRGAKGEPGQDGVTPTFSIESVETGEPGTYADVTMTGDAPNHGLRFVIPRGDKGNTGAAGADGKTPYVGDNGNWFVGSDDTGKPSRGAKGDKGDPGATPNLTVGTVTTLEAGQNATASMGGTAESPVLNLGIPRGAKGEPGEGGGGGTYYVELDGNYPDLTLSETTPLADIAAAYNEGKALFCRLSTAHHTVSLPLFMSLTELNIWIFGGSGGTAAIYTPAEYATIVVGEQGVTAENNGLVLTNSIVTSVSTSSTNSEVPSAKCLYDELQKRNLKQATSDILGGVKADPAEAADTQPVRIGGDGKLYTAPGGTDISLGLTSASVGQTVKVKAIDESGKPTAWEAADMPSGGGHWETVLDTVWEQDVINPTAFDSETGIFTCAEGELNNLALGTEYVFFQQCTKEGVAYNTILGNENLKVTKLSDTTFSINVTPPTTFVPTNVKFSRGACLGVTDIDAKKIRLTLDGQFKPTATLYDRPFYGAGVPFFGQNTGHAQIRNAYQAYQQVTAEVESPYRIVGEILCGFNAPSQNASYHFKNNAFCCPLIPYDMPEGNQRTYFLTSDGTKIAKLYSTSAPHFIGTAYENTAISTDYLTIISGTKVKLERWVE